MGWLNDRSGQRFQAIRNCGGAGPGSWQTGGSIVQGNPPGDPFTVGLVVEFPWRVGQGGSYTTTDPTYDSHIVSVN